MFVFCGTDGALLSDMNISVSKSYGLIFAEGCCEAFCAIIATARAISSGQTVSDVT